MRKQSGNKFHIPIYPNLSRIGKAERRQDTLPYCDQLIGGQLAGPPFSGHSVMISGFLEAIQAKE